MGAVGLERDAPPLDVCQQCLDIINIEGQKMWQSWAWRNAKIDEFDAPAPDSNGIITFDATVGVIRAVRATSIAAGSDSVLSVFNQDEVAAAQQGEEVGSGRWVALADDSDGCRRVKVDTTNDTGWKVLALKRWVKFQMADSDTSETYYTTARIPITELEPALLDSLTDALRARSTGAVPSGNAGSAVANAIRQEMEVEQREKKVIPRNPLFGDVGNYPFDGE